MKIPPVSAVNLANRQVELSEFVVVAHHPPTSSNIPTAPQPSMYAQRLEREMRNAAVSVPPEVQVTPPMPEHVSGTCKKVCDTAFLVCGAAAIPSFVCVVFGPWGLLAPVALLTAAGVFAAIRGEPTPEMLQAYERRAENNRANDCQGV